VGVPDEPGGEVPRARNLRLRSGRRGETGEGDEDGQDDDSGFADGRHASLLCIAIAARRPRVYLLTIAAATTLATRLRKGTIWPLSSGWTLFVRKMTMVSVSGSIQIDVPV